MGVQTARITTSSSKLIQCQNSAADANSRVKREYTESKTTMSTLSTIVLPACQSDTTPGSPASSRKSDFITLYTDASFNHKESRAKIAFKGKCAWGSIDGSLEIRSHDIHHAEMAAILLGVKTADERFPNLIGFFVNSDNISCVKSFWSFGNFKTPGPATTVKEEILKIVGSRWIRTKHVKAHTRGRDIRSHMNRTVDRMTRVHR